MATARVALAALAIMTAASGCHGSADTTTSTTSSKSSSFYPTRDAGSECPPTDEWRARDTSGQELECWQRNPDKIERGFWWAVHVPDGPDAIGSPCPRDGIPGITYVPVPAGSKPESGFRLLMCQDGKWKNTPEGWPEGTSA